MKKLMFIGAVIFLTLAVSVIAAAEETKTGLAQKAGARRILSERSKLVTTEGHGKYYLVKPGRYFYEKEFAPIDGEVQPLLSSRWRARQKSTQWIERPVIGTRHVRTAGRFLNTPKEEQDMKQHRYYRRTLGSSKVDVPANPRGRYYFSPKVRYGKFTDKLTNGVVN